MYPKIEDNFVMTVASSSDTSPSHINTGFEHNSDDVSVGDLVFNYHFLKKLQLKPRNDDIENTESNKDSEENMNDQLHSSNSTLDMSPSAPPLEDADNNLPKSNLKLYLISYLNYLENLDKQNLKF